MLLEIDLAGELAADERAAHHLHHQRERRALVGRRRPSAHRHRQWPWDHWWDCRRDRHRRLHREMRPSRAASWTSPCAMTEVAMSKTRGRASRRGVAKAIGLVPSAAFPSAMGYDRGHGIDEGERDQAFIRKRLDIERGARRDDANFGSRAPRSHSPSPSRAQRPGRAPRRVR